MIMTTAGLGQLLENTSALEVFSGRRPWILALDYDGTLAPFRPERDHAQPYAGMRDVLNRLPTRGESRFVLISGRDATDVSRLLNIEPPPEIWGCHGAQRLTPKGVEHLASLSSGQVQALAQAQSLVPDASLVEIKPCSVAVHWRGLDREQRSALEEEIRPRLHTLAEDSGLELHPFDGGLELRLPGVNKGAAIQALLREHPESLIFYLGDDLTDEDAFLALKDRGIGVLVRQKPHATHAAYWIKPPQELLTLLGRFTSVNPRKRSILGGP